MEYKIVRTEDYLAHHGILGQKWGVRRYQNEDGTLTEEGKRRNKSKDYYILPKGSAFNSVSPFKYSNQYLKRKRPIYLYEADNKWDSAVYKGPFTRFKMKSGYNYIYEHKFKTTKDLKMPTDQERFSQFMNIFNDYPISKIELSSIQRLMNSYDIGSESAKKIDLSNIKTREDYEAAYEIFNHAMENYTKFSVTKAYVKLMSKKYDAMVDDNNYKSYNRAQNPIIVFKANKALKAIGDTSIVTVEDMWKNYDYVRDELSKKGEQILL